MLYTEFASRRNLEQEQLKPWCTGLANRQNLEQEHMGTNFLPFANTIISYII